MFRVPGFIDARIDFAKLLNCCCLVAYALQNAGGNSFLRRKKDLTHRLTEYPKFCIGMPVVRTDGRADGRVLYGHVITKFSGRGRFTYPWCSAMKEFSSILTTNFRLFKPEFVYFFKKCKVVSFCVTVSSVKGYLLKRKEKCIIHT